MCLTGGRTLLIFVLLAVPCAGRAQQFQGELRSDAGDAPVSGALITLLDVDGRVIRAVLTDAEGRFRLAAPGAGVYHLQAEHIGYSAARAGPLRVEPDAVVTVPMRIVVHPITLDALEVTGTDACRVRPEEGMFAFTLWERAAVALRSAAVLQDLEMVEYSVATYEREVALPRGRMHTERQAAVRVRGRPFATLTADDLADHGYVHVTDDEVLYHGPDAHVLLSDRFLDTHCLRAQRRGAERAGLIGIAFEPVRGRPVPDITGVLWLDGATGELQYLVYQYTGLDDPRVAPASGRIEFDRLDSGAWVISRWWIRMTRGRGQGRPQGYFEMGGEIVDVELTGSRE
jgi:hypothetical protein